MMLRSAALLMVVALLAGCDSASDAPSTFTATYSGAASGTATGSYAYTRQFLYRNLGDRDVYVIRFGEAEPTQPGFSVALNVEGVGEPSSTFIVGTGATATFAVDGLNYEATAGTFTVARRGDRFAGTFDFTDSTTLTAAAGPVVMRGTFDVARTN